MNFYYLTGGAACDDKKLKEYGFVCANGVYTAERVLPGCGMRAEARIADGSFTVSVYDAETGEKYALFDVEEETGGFVAAVRALAAEFAEDIADKCFARSDKIAELLDFAVGELGAEISRPWERYPDYAVIRDPVSRKWFGLAMKIDKRLLVPGESGVLEIVNVKAAPEDAAAAADGKKVFAAYHMNKKHWITLSAEQNSADELKQRLAASRELVTDKKRASKGVRRGIGG